MLAAAAVELFAARREGASIKRLGHTRAGENFVLFEIDDHDLVLPIARVQNRGVGKLGMKLDVDRENRRA